MPIACTQVHVSVCNRNDLAAAFATATIYSVSDTWHLLDFHVHLKLTFPFDRDHVEIPDDGCGTHNQEFVQVTTMTTGPVVHL
jgi:hypothetical protein